MSQSVDRNGPVRWRCRVLGHHHTFRVDGTTMRWQCARGCVDGAGEKTYATAAQAQLFAAALDHRDTVDLGARAPLLSLFPLRIWRRLCRREPSRATKHGDSPV